MENKVQVEKLKLNVTNIKSTLISSNKKLRKIQIEKDQLVLKLTKDQTRRKAEDSVEKKNIKGSGILGRIVGKIAAPVMNLWDRVLNFVGAILLGFVITKLPEIINTLKPVLSIVQPIFVSVFKGLGIITESMIDLIGAVNDLQEFISPSKNNLDESKKLLEEISGDKLDEPNELNGTNESNNQSSSDVNLNQQDTQIDISEPTQQVENTQKVTPIAPTTNLMGEVQKRNEGGVINKPQDANLPPQSRGLGEVSDKNPFKRFYKATNQNLKNTGVFSEVVEKFEKLVKGMNFMMDDVNVPTGQPRGNSGTDSRHTTPPRTLIGGDSLAAILPQGAPQFTSTFGMRKGRQHNGIDIGVDAGSPVIASQGGEVLDIYPNFGYHGDAVVVKYNDGFKGIYGHIDPSVSIGAKVVKGSVLGTVKYWPNGYGNADNTHLHYERVDPSGVHIDPAPYVNGLKSGVYNDHFKNNKGGEITRLLNSRNLSGDQSNTDMTIAILPMYQRIDNYVNSNTPQMSGGLPSNIGNLMAFTGKRVDLQTFRLG